MLTTLKGNGVKGALAVEEAAKMRDMTHKEAPDICVLKTRECKLNTCICHLNR